MATSRSLPYSSLVEVGNDLSTLAALMFGSFFQDPERVPMNWAGEPGGTFNALLRDLQKPRAISLGDLFVEFNGPSRIVDVR